MQRDCALGIARGERSEEFADITDDHARVQPDVIAGSQEGVGAEGLPHCIKRLRERMPRARIRALRPEQTDEPVAAAWPVARRSEEAEQGEPSALGMTASQWRAVALQRNPAESAKTKHVRRFDNGVIGG